MKFPRYRSAQSPFEPAAMQPDDLVLEGIVITLDASGQPNIAPMGPRVDREISRLLLRPFPSSQTYQNLKATGRGVFHVTDIVGHMKEIGRAHV